MQTKLLALLFITTVLASSFIAYVMPTANALTTRTDFSDRHTSASYGNSRICGDHICKPGEQTQWLNKMAELQREGTGKIGKASTYLDALKYIQSNSTSTMHEHLTVIEKMKMGENMIGAGNMTSAGNMTKGTK